MSWGDKTLHCHHRYLGRVQRNPPGRHHGLACDPGGNGAIWVPWQLHGREPKAWNDRHGLGDEPCGDGRNFCGAGPGDLSSSAKCPRRENARKGENKPQPLAMGRRRSHDCSRTSPTKRMPSSLGMQHDVPSRDGNRSPLLRPDDAIVAGRILVPVARRLSRGAIVQQRRGSPDGGLLRSASSRRHPTVPSARVRGAALRGTAEKSPAPSTSRPLQLQDWHRADETVT